MNISVSLCSIPFGIIPLEPPHEGDSNDIQPVQSGQRLTVLCITNHMGAWCDLCVIYSPICVLWLSSVRLKHCTHFADLLVRSMCALYVVIRWERPAAVWLTSIGHTLQLRSMRLFTNNPLGFYSITTGCIPLDAPLRGAGNSVWPVSIGQRLVKILIGTCHSKWHLVFHDFIHLAVYW